MAVGLNAPEALQPVPGIRVAAVAAGIRYPGRDDLVLIDAGPDATVAALYTNNAFRAAPVVVAAEHQAAGGARWLLINAGNANAGTGELGLAAARACCEALAAVTGDPAEAVLPFSTGVIGEPLPVERIIAALPVLHAGLAPNAWMQAGRAIMTTDTVLKGVSRRVALSQGEVTLTGIAKGSGMIHPDMATMLAFIGTDLAIEAQALDGLLREANRDSFNAITVDGDTSTNDAVVVMASGASGAGLVTADDRVAFAAALDAVCLELAQAIVRDGEGATKFVTVEVVGARSREEAAQVAETVALSPLVKTALFASDPNWGRILAAVGRAGVPDLEIERVAIRVNDVEIVRDGGRAPEYAEADGQRAFDAEEIHIRIDLGRGDARTRKYTCDFSHEYVRINAEYRS
ncbi:MULTISPECIES: bifunctional glutamate N-acetyltransferase/amino-acid acetyltransferase ArgJ [Thioalkalivibrio]|uniref:bifunctional glutamate N-acetyltransferase/amino-acid acetyltransferase ArgJ n=1 Tax=Thioalkalivibrio TaxID=106633 RepID=UPI000382E32B|nr:MULTISPECIES: bifunctional glutamate N-acetyltransferase/amino-acid acetyltransferase ArgJ [Thioalkalivibrio]OOC49863.1 bifunctional ornithine acetyltransferase/N-acetylglutamate synthase [Thioalkalivibrio versutus]